MPSASLVGLQQRQQGPVRYAVFGHNAGAMFCFGVAARVAAQLGQAPLN